MTGRQTSAVDEIRRLMDVNGGRLEPEDVVKAAKAKRSPLHPHFTWDDAQAAHEHRLNQARGLIRNVRVEVTVGDEVRMIRAFVSVPNDVDDVDAGEVYRRIEDVAADAELRARFVAQLEREWRAFTTKWNHHRDYLEGLARDFLRAG